MTPPYNAWRELGIFKRQHPFPTIPCAVVGSPDFHTTTRLLHDDPSSQELGLDSSLDTTSRISFFHPRKLLKNVTGTRRLSEAAIHHGVKTSVLISTDKAANPANVVGATQWLGELYVQALARDAAHGLTVFCAVHFGIVFGSNGSVVRIFLQQIECGWPVTITYPEITRYFMTIPEAIQLVLQAATLAKEGESVVFEMEEQVKLLDMARNLIRLAGYIPDVESPMIFIGVRPVVKPHEELIGEGERLEPSEVEKILREQLACLLQFALLTHAISELKCLTIV